MHKKDEKKDQLLQDSVVFLTPIPPFCLIKYAQDGSKTSTTLLKNDIFANFAHYLFSIAIYQFHHS